MAFFYRWLHSLALSYHPGDGLGVVFSALSFVFCLVLALPLSFLLLLRPICSALRLATSSFSFSFFTAFSISLRTSFFCLLLFPVFPCLLLASFRFRLPAPSVLDGFLCGFYFLVARVSPRHSCVPCGWFRCLLCAWAGCSTLSVLFSLAFSHLAHSR